MAHRLFADWHRSIEIDPNPINLDARWSVIETFAQALTAHATLAIARLAHERQADQAIGESFAQAFKAVEPAFPMRDNQRLIGMLAGATLVEVLDKRTDAIANMAAYAIDAAARIDWKPLVPDLPPQASTFLIREADRIRVGVAFPPASKPPQVIAKSLKDQLEAAPDAPTLGKATSELGTKTQTALSALAAQLELLSNWAKSAFIPLQEENDMMWWLLSGGSQILGQDWAKTAPSPAALVAGWELAPLVRLLPGPTSSDRLISQLVRFATADTGSTASSSIKKAVDQLPKSISLPPLDELVGELTPILCEAHHKPTEQGIAERPRTPLALGQQAYTERLLIRAYQEARVG